MEPIDAPTPYPCLIEHAGQYKMSSLCEVITVSGSDIWVGGLVGLVIGIFLTCILSAIFD